MRFTDLRTGYPCNQRCRFCDQEEYVSVSNVSLVDASTAEVVAAMKAIGHREGLVLAGGEVTLRADLPTVITQARTLGFRRVALQTNGHILASAGAAAHLRTLGLTDVALALHSPEASVHDWLTDTPGSWKRAAAAARQCRAAGLTLRIHAVVTRTTTPQVGAMVALAVRLGATTVRFSPCREEGRARGTARMLAPRLSLVAEAVAAALDGARQAGMEVETVGLPLCLNPELRALAADRSDVVQATRAFALAAEPARERAYGPDCGQCSLRAVCPGVEAAYVARWGADELVPVGAAASAPEQLELELGAGLSSRELRQRLVKAQGAGVLSVRFVGEAAGTHPDRGALVRECERLGLGVLG